ncbi:hypothetical protein HF086_010147 [Spodoptera exigua]|uniref:histone deacetylase n=1 Tax=Spodoptera exigua TaxID=7107 RepID=A0A922MY07_SPOEX|nr:hypothetical protein HF086_010147 [Spodoptera exigua]
MAHESGGAADGSPQHTPSPPHAPRLPLADTSFHQQIMQSCSSPSIVVVLCSAPDSVSLILPVVAFLATSFSCSENQNPRKNHIAERAKQTLESSFLMQLKKQQQLQQEILLQHFQQQRQQLAQEHEQQLMHHLKVNMLQLWEQQKAMEEAAARREAREALEAREARERHERHERDRVDLLRKKDKHEHSANASTEVKQKLQQFLKKKQASANGTVPGSSYRNWGIVKSSSGESITSTGATATHPYRLAAPLPLALNAAPPQSSPDYPLRKTGTSSYNPVLCTASLSCAVTQFDNNNTTSEPNMLKVRLKARVIERRASPLARRPFKTRVKHRNCDGSSPRGSPPGGAGVGGAGGAGATAPIREEEEGCGRAADLLFSSPSMPNISLGRPHQPAPRLHPAPPPLAVLPPVSEAEGWAALGGRLAKRPLGRTHSAPLPLGDPALTPPSAHHYLRDQIRKTQSNSEGVESHELRARSECVVLVAQVLTRAHDAAAAQLREEEGEVIDLTARRAPAAAAATPAPPCEPAPLARALSSPLVGARTPATGLAYDALMLKHGCACGAHAPTHPEHGGRLQSVWARLCETGLVARAERTRPRKATFEELQVGATCLLHFEAMLIAQQSFSNIMSCC